MTDPSNKPEKAVSEEEPIRDLTIDEFFYVMLHLVAAIALYNVNGWLLLFAICWWLIKLMETTRPTSPGNKEEAS